MHRTHLFIVRPALKICLFRISQQLKSHAGGSMLTDFFSKNDFQKMLNLFGKNVKKKLFFSSEASIHTYPAWKSETSLFLIWV